MTTTTLRIADGHWHSGSHCVNATGIPCVNATGIPCVATIDRLYSDQRNLLETLESLGSVVTTLSTIGTTTVRTGR